MRGSVTCGPFPAVSPPVPRSSGDHRRAQRIGAAPARYNRRLGVRPRHLAAMRVGAIRTVIESRQAGSAARSCELSAEKSDAGRVGRNEMSRPIRTGVRRKKGAGVASHRLDLAGGRAFTRWVKRSAQCRAGIARRSPPSNPCRQPEGGGQCPPYMGSFHTRHFHAARVSGSPSLLSPCTIPRRRCAGGAAMSGGSKKEPQRTQRAQRPQRKAGKKMRLRSPAAFYLCALCNLCALRVRCGSLASTRRQRRGLVSRSPADKHPRPIFEPLEHLRRHAARRVVQHVGQDLRGDERL